MAPAFDAGSVVIVKPFPAEEVAVGDVITYKDTEDNTTLVTHRVAAISPENDLAFTTRGDANNSDDHTPVPAANLVGKVQMAVPYAGYIVDFARTKQGLLAMVIVPGILIIIFELRNLMICAEALEKEKKAKQAKRIAEQIEPQSCSIQPKEVTAAETNDV
jgi:signal peptidase